MDLIENYIEKNELDWHMHLRYCLTNTSNIPNKLKEKIDFLTNKMDFIYKDDLYTNNPFQPMMIFADGRRSLTVEDLNSYDVQEIKDLINYTKHPILLGKLYDVLWIIEKDNNYALKASELYIDYFIDNRNSQERYKIISPLRRGLYILCALKQDDLLKQNIDKILNLRKYQNKDDKRIIIYYIADLLDKVRKSFLSKYIKNIENVLAKNINNDDITLKLIEIVINYYKSIKNNILVEKWILKYVSTCEAIEEIQSPHGHEYLTKAINMLDTSKHDKLINDLMIKRDKSQKKMHDSFKMHEITLDTSEIDVKINSFRNQIINNLKKLKSVQQFIYLLKEFRPIPEKDIIKQINERKKHNVFADLFPTIAFGENRTIIYDQSKANKFEKQEYEYAEHYRMSNPIAYTLVLQPYLANAIVDEDLKSLIKEIIEHNLFVPQDRSKQVTDDIIYILNKQFRLGLFDLIPQFENGCRFYFKDYKNIYPVVKHGSKYDEINLNDILVKKEKTNKFRNALLEILDSDLLLELEYLLCRPLSSNIRNRYVHDGCGSHSEFTFDEVVTSFLLIKAYCLGYDNEINKKTP